ncbi:Uncharacterized protein PECH_001543 [Penicillium ucsense]|uniref:PQ loop repeat protein n=1 Tax=Penicillium ucsense TaxID=2839758 RepID=A0A8J8W3M4_9EURO|nr:Uncharacterized protein PECM_006641 [Penicillium ucsense]KAF7732664.1 Uncharacterized protein PECH_001543 [Penicillium ucsense]
MGSLSPTCADLAYPGWVQPLISIIIIVGILISYLPQHIRIITRGTSFGISPWFVLLGTTSGTSAFVNILSFPKTAVDVGCCREVSGFACFAGLLGVVQLGMQWLCFFTILLLYVIYFPRATSSTDPTRSEDAAPEGQGPTYRTALAVTATCVFYTLLTAIISVALAMRRPSALEGWANFLGVFAAVLASIQYFPQIYTTWRIRGVGSLSIPMMCIQTPGGLLWAGSLAARTGIKGWSIWGVIVVTAVLQGVLLSMAVYFKYFGDSKSKQKDLDEDEQDGQANGAGEDASAGDASTMNPSSAATKRPSEETPLLQGE